MTEMDAPQPDLEELQQEHRDLEERLQRLERPRSMSPQERYRAQQIKKRKLALKDKMASMQQESSS